METYGSALMNRRTQNPTEGLAFMSARGWLVALWSGVRHGLPRVAHEPALRSRACIVLAAVFVCLDAVGVVAYVATLPDIGIRSAFSPLVNHFHEDFLFPAEQKTPPPRNGDRL